MPLYDKKCFNCAESIKQSHIPHNCEHILYAQPRFPTNLTILIIQLQEARINLIGYNDSVIRPQLYPNGIILAQQIVVYIRHISQHYPKNVRNNIINYCGCILSFMHESTHCAVLYPKSFHLLLCIMLLYCILWSFLLYTSQRGQSYPGVCFLFNIVA